MAVWPESSLPGWVFFSRLLVGCPAGVWNGKKSRMDGYTGEWLILCNDKDYRKKKNPETEQKNLSFLTVSYLKKVIISIYNNNKYAYGRECTEIHLINSNLVLFVFVSKCSCFFLSQKVSKARRVVNWSNWRMPASQKRGIVWAGIWMEGSQHTFQFKIYLAQIILHACDCPLVIPVCSLYTVLACLSLSSSSKEFNSTRR